MPGGVYMYQKLLMIMATNPTEITLDGKQLIKVIHDIRNPLMAIKLAHEQLQEEPGKKDNEAQAELNDIITRNIERIEQYLKQIIQLEKTQPAKPTRFDLARLLDSALRKASDRIFLSGVKIQGNYMNGHFVEGNAEELTTAFLNIILNAIEATQPNTGKLWIAVYEIDRHVKIVFKDNGHGMTEEMTKRLLEVPNSNKPNGLGIGLSYVKKVLEQHRASISFMSEPGTGTTVAITFTNYNG